VFFFNSFISKNVFQKDAMHFIYYYPTIIIFHIKEFLHLRTPYLETGRVTIPKINPNIKIYDKDLCAKIRKKTMNSWRVYWWSVFLNSFISKNAFQKDAMHFIYYYPTNIIFHIKGAKKRGISILEIIYFSSNFNAFCFCKMIILMNYSLWYDHSMSTRISSWNSFAAKSLTQKPKLMEEICLNTTWNLCYNHCRERNTSNM
jgi:hypothetical protein